MLSNLAEDTDKNWEMLGLNEIDLVDDRCHLWALPVPTAEKSTYQQWVNSKAKRPTAPPNDTADKQKVTTYEG
jgi:hypothetical protein